MMLASTMAGIAMNPTRLGLAHALAMPLGSWDVRVPHGIALAVTLPAVMEFPSERAGFSCHTVLEPLGVVAAICPWNSPVVTPVRKIAPALAYGNTVVFKPASLTPWSAVCVMKLLEKAGLPSGVGRRVQLAHVREFFG